MKNFGFTKLLIAALFISVIGIANSLAQISFTTDVTSGCAPLTVNFQNTSNTGVTYQIYFDDGSGGFWTGTDTVHTYNTPGYYYPILYSYDAQGNFIGQFNSVGISIDVAQTAFSQSATSVCLGDNVGFSAYIEQGSTYFWDFGDGDTLSGSWVNHTYTTYNTYNILLITTGQCGVDTIVQTLTVDSSTVPTADFGFYPDPACPLQPVNFFSYNDNVAGYFWDFDDGNTSTEASPSNPYTTTGFYDVSLVITNGCGNTDTTSNQLEVKDNTSFPPMQLNVNWSPSCPNGIVNTGAPGGYLFYVWNPGDGTPTDSTTNPWFNYSYSDTGTYYQSCRIYDYCGNDTLLTDSVVISDSTGFINIFPINAKSPICPGETNYISAPGGYPVYVYNYDDGSPQDSITSDQNGHVYTDTGTFVASVKIYNYCGFDTILYNTIIVTNGAGFQNGINISFDPLHCPGEEVDMNTYGGHQAYVWTFGDGSPQDSNDYGGSRHIYQNTGTYPISVTITNYCGADTTIYDTVVIDDNVGFPSVMNMWTYPNPVCPNDRVSLNTESGYINYSWNFGDGTTVQTSTSWAANSYDSAGIYQASVTITNGCGLDTTLTTGVMVDTNAPFPSQIILDVPSAVTCPGDAVNFFVWADYPMYFWDFGNGDTLTTSNKEISHTYDSVGTFTIYVTIFNGCGNQITLSKTILVDSNNTFVDPSIGTINNTVCPGDIITIAPSDESGTSYIYYWDLGDGNVDTTYGFGVTHSYADTGTYVVNVIAVNACGFSDSSYLTIYVLDNAMPSLGQSDDFFGVAGGGGGGGAAGCPGDAIIFYFAGLYTNVWDFGDGSSASATNSLTTPFGEFAIITHAYQDTGSYWATLTITNNCGNSLTDSVLVVIGSGLAVNGDVFPEPPTTGAYTTCEGITFLAMGGTSYYIDYGDGTTLTTNSSTTTHYFSTSGTYTVSVLVTNSCGNSATYNVQVTVINGGGASVSSSIAVDITCNGGNDGMIISNATGGTMPYSYIWDDPAGQTSQLATGLSAGIYTVTITDANGCSGTSSTGLADPAAITGTGTTVPAGCGSANGSLTITGLTGGTAPYTFLWDNGDNTNTADSLASGTYTVTITDANNCISSQTIILSDSGGVSISSATITNSSCNGGSDGAVDITISGGTAPYTYLWSNGETIEDISGLQAETYSVTVTDSSGCKTIQSGIVGEPDPVTITTSIVNANCGVADGSITITAAGGTSPYTYNWSTGTTTSSDTGLVAGAYTVTVTDNNTCPTTFTITVSNANAPVITSVISNISCNGLTDGAIDVTVVGGTTPYVYVWTNGGFTQDINGLSDGSYILFLFDGGGCQTAQTFDIIEPDVLAVASTVTGSHCGYNDGTATATATGGTGAYTYSWSSGGSSSTETGIGTGNETVTVTDANGCSVLDSVTIVTTVDEQPICIITVDTTSTMNVVVWEKPEPALGIASFNVYREILSVYTLVGTVLYNSLSEFTDTTNSVDPNATSYRYKVTAVDSCSNESAQSEYHETIHMTVNLGFSPIINLIWDNYEGFTFTNYHILRDSMGLGNWDTLISLSSSSTTYTDANSPQTSGLRYQIIVIAPSMCVAEKAKNFNSSKSNSTSINNPTALGGSTGVTNESQASACDGTATANPTGGIEPYTYAWSTTPAQTNATAIGLCSGNYSVFVTDDNGDTLTLNAFVGVVPGIAEGSNANLMQVFPNPNRGHFTVNFTIIERESAEIKIYDLQGRLVETRLLGRIQGSFVEEINIAQYGSGLYYLQLKTESSVHIKKIVVE